MDEHVPASHYMCAKYRGIDFRRAFFVKRTEPDMLELCVHNVFSDIVHILSTCQDCRCCSLILSGISRFYPALLAEKNTKVAWQSEGRWAAVEVQNGEDREVEYRSVVYILLRFNSDRVLAINLLSPQNESAGSNALRARRVSQRQAERRSGFASWSWAGWIGKSRYVSMNPNVIKPMVRYRVSENETGGNHTFACIPQEWESENYEPSARPWRVLKPGSPTTLPMPHPGLTCASHTGTPASTH